MNTTNKTRRPVIITPNGEPKAVMHDHKSYENTCNATSLLKLISQGEADIVHGRIKSQENVFKSLRLTLHQIL